jgi:mannitol/fructose-specific phosphotransferase system IIA component (Ntr-type)/phosphotransferase system HPr-like phosphotransfer protein
MPESQIFQYDVFLSHNSKDKPTVRELKRRLLAKGLTVWLDEDELRPGIPWQQLLEAGIRASRSVAVLVGKDGVGPWEDEEMQAALILAVNSKRPVMPVVLSGAPEEPKLPMFLENRTWVKLDSDLTEATLARLVWGITGSKPALPETPARASEPRTEFNRGVLCRLSCRDSDTTALHLRPITFLRTLCNKFPATEFRLFKLDKTVDPLGRPADMRNQMDMMISSFHHGEMVVLEVSGKLLVMSATFLRIALENLEGYSDDPVATTANIGRQIDEASIRLYDPDLGEPEDPVNPVVREPLEPPKNEHRSIAVINDRLHDVSLVMIPLIAKHFGCELLIAFEHPEKGVFSFAMDQHNQYNLDKSILDLEIQVGTRITIVTKGSRSVEAGAAVRNVLQNLWQCDHWIRSRTKNFDSEAAVPGLVEYAREIGRHYSQAYGHAQNPFISNLIAQSVFVNAPGTPFSKEAALEQLAAPHARRYDLKVAEVVKCVMEVEIKQSVIPRPGFAIVHAAMDWGPRISISLGVYPDGVVWSPNEAPINLVAMVICTRGTYNTWRDYLKRFANVFRSVPNLQNQLVASRSSEEFVTVLRNAEVSLAKA